MTPLQRRLSVLAAIALFTAIGFFWFPGHTFLLSDTQVYLPILQHIENPSALAADPMAIRPHVGLTVWDDIVLVLRRMTGGAKWDHILLPVEFLCRAAGLAGLYLLARATGLGTALSLAAMALLGLGATINGPQVLSIEYEPVPRGFALPLSILALGLLAHARHRAAAAAIALAWALHPVTAAPVWALAGFLAAKRREWRRMAMLLAPGPILLAVTLPFQPPATDPLPFFERVDDALAALQKMRASYVFVSTWFRQYSLHFLALLSVAMLAFLRIRTRVPQSVRPMFWALPLLGAMSVPVSWLVVERERWMIGPQYQPARYVLYIVLFAAFSSALAAFHRARSTAWFPRKIVETWMLLLPACVIPLAPNLLDITPLRLQLGAGMALCLTLLASCRWPALVLAGALLPFGLYPTLGQVRNYTAADSPELDELIAWAHANTPQNAVFQFADVRRGPEPGIFRSRAARAIYADWKAGGQVNHQPDFARLWGERWKQVERPQPLSRYRELGIDYVVFSAPKAPKNATPSYANARWVVIRVS